MLQLVFLASATTLVFSSHLCIAADKTQIQESIRKAQEFLVKQKLTGGEGSIAALAFIKSGGDKKAAVVQQVVEEVLAKFETGTYLPLQHHNYEAGVDMMLLETIDEKRFRPQIEAGVAYLLSTQQPNGAWFYPGPTEPDSGDTSITQYAILGLWTGSRVGVPIPVESLERAARWHIAKQLDDGGFAYHPYESTQAQKTPNDRTSVGTMTAAGTSSLLIIRRMLFGDVGQDAEIAPPDSKRRFGVLERFVDERVATVNRKTTMRISLFDNALKQSVRWIVSHYRESNSRYEVWFSYELYCVERVGALMDVVELGNRDWYEEGADDLLRRQHPDGSWTQPSVPTTALALLFLSKATTTLVVPKPKVNLLGGGLQAGGRGLPDNLDAVQVKDGTVSSRKMVGHVDNLLIELERSSDAKVIDVQAAVVEAVQLDRPEDLIGQVERLRKLADDPRIEVRRTALWALGRSGDVSTVPSLIRGLSDPDLSVVREASLGLCIFSRRPEGCGKAIDPTDDSQMGIKANATDQERKTILEAWQRESIRRWLDWYQKNRSYDARDDKTTLRRSNK